MLRTSYIINQISIQNNKKINLINQLKNNKYNYKAEFCNLKKWLIIEKIKNKIFKFGKKNNFKNHQNLILLKMQ